MPQTMEHSLGQVRQEMPWDAIADELARSFNPRDKKRDRVRRLLTLLAKSENKTEAKEVLTTLFEVLNLSKLRFVSITATSDPEARSKLGKYRAHLGATIRRVRERKGWTQTQLAAKAELPQPHVSRIETGEHAPTFMTISKIAGALGVRPGDLDPGCED